MSTNRRTRLAKTLAHTTDLTYQQALAHLDAHTAAGHPLPRTTDDLAELVATPTRPAHVTALRRIRDLPAPDQIKTIRFSDIGRCPISDMTPDHYLADGTCGHARPVCPTCAGTGTLISDGDVELACAATTIELMTGTPVCDATGTWTGGRATGHRAQP